jgi:5,10-methylene-tetrahydrofolate dehydrogenase/methenyl tetrahydrofolate cyclohydrolase
VAYILNDTTTSLVNKKVVIVGRGKLVGEPVAIWFKQQGAEPILIDINTPLEDRMVAYKEADIVVSGIGKPHHLKKEFFKSGVILIDAGTSEQAGVLAGDFDPSCSEIASIITPVPGGVGPLTVACLFRNIFNQQQITLL